MPRRGRRRLCLHDLLCLGVDQFGDLGLIVLGQLPGLLALIAGLVVEEPTKGDF